MANIYKQTELALHELIEKASADSGATILIPDLQRPYVWTPSQVTLLVDSLIRGWPFGTLLMWRVKAQPGGQAANGMPARPLWKMIDRTGDSNGDPVSKMNPPAEYHMVLDGQQRVQSLLIAFRGDDSGFKLEDRVWTEELRQQRPRGRQPKYAHWSKASLCFDLDAFKKEYDAQNRDLLSIDFRKVLQWAITDPHAGQSQFPKPQNYENPLPRAFEDGNQTRLVRLSRLWDLANADSAMKEKQFQDKLSRHFNESGIPLADGLLQALGELMTTLRDLKLTNVTCLELQPLNPDIWSRETYNDAIVNIFTRLNTAGRTLTSEEITFAWLKVGWQPAHAGKSAGQCFADLIRELRDLGLALETDELVRAASFVWAVAHRDGKLLTESDLLEGDVIQPMAADVSTEWPTVVGSFRRIAEILRDRDIEYGTRGQFSSLYALAVLFAWAFIAESWTTNRKIDEMSLDDFRKRSRESILHNVDRWIMCSQWAGVWSRSSISSIEAYSRSLSDAHKSILAMNDPERAHQAWDACFAGLLSNVLKEAETYVTDLAASRRERVNIYRNVLWTWNRLTPERSETSRIPMRVGKSKATIEVDHIVPVALWDQKSSDLPTHGEPKHDPAQLEELVNSLGNCLLLEKNFNISKGKQGLHSFLAKMSEVKQGIITAQKLCSDLSIPDAMRNPEQAALSDLIKAIKTREEKIRNELTQFIQGERTNDKDRETGHPPSAPPQTRSASAAEAYGAESQQAPDAPGPRLGITQHPGLHEAYLEDSTLRLIVDHFANRQNNQWETKIDSLLHKLSEEGSKITKPELLEAFRRLDALGIGKSIVGRKGHPSRFKWYQESTKVRSLAMAGASHTTPPPGVDSDQ